MESLANICDIIPGIYGQYFEIWRKESWGKTLTGVLPRVMLLPYVTTNCSVHFKFDISTYNGHNRNVNFSMYLTEKRLSYQNCRFIFINLRLLVVYLTYSPGYDTSNIPMYIICSCIMAKNDWKITDMILFLGSTLGNIHSKCAIVYLWISFALDCICWLATLTQRWFTCAIVVSNMECVCHKWSNICINDTYHTNNAQLCG